MNGRTNQRAAIRISWNSVSPALWTSGSADRIGEFASIHNGSYAFSDPRARD